MIAASRLALRFGWCLGLVLAPVGAVGDEASPSPAPLAVAAEAAPAEPTASADPCEAGRLLSRMAPCLADDEDCAAVRFWARRFGPSRPVPAAPERTAEAVAGGENLPDLRRGAARHPFPPFGVCPAASPATPLPSDP